MISQITPAVGAELEYCVGAYAQIIQSCISDVAPELAFDEDAIQRGARAAIEEGLECGYLAFVAGVIRIGTNFFSGQDG